MKHKKYYGFTIVELLIVIVVIGVLAAISVAAYSDIKRRTENTVRLVELRQWEKLFVLYEAKNGDFPSVWPGDYCLGTGFPTKNDINSLIQQWGVGEMITGTGNPDGYCRDLLWNSSRLEVNSSLNEQLATIATLPGKENHSRVIKDLAAVGPYVSYWGYIRITALFNATSCPDGLQQGYTYNGQATMCFIELKPS